jgi:intermembrane space import and assembly protein 40
VCVRDMQNCFREHPDVYGSELESDAADEEDEQHDLGAAVPAHAESTHSDATPTHSEATPSAAYSDSTPAPPSKPSNASSKPPPNPTSSPSATESAPADKAKHFSQRSSQPASGADQPGKSASAWDKEPTSESEELVPKGAHDARERGTERLGRK